MLTSVFKVQGACRSRHVKLDLVRSEGVLSGSRRLPLKACETVISNGQFQSNRFKAPAAQGM